MATTTNKKRMAPNPAPCSQINLRSASFARHVAIISFLCIAAERQANAAEWIFTPTLTVRETYSDNINQQSSGSEQAGFITEVIPTFELHGTGRRLKLNATYSLDQVLYHQGTTRSSLRHALSSDVFTELVDDWLYFDGRASVSQQSIDAFGPQVFNNIGASGNRAEVRTLTLSPYLRHRFSDIAKAELRYTRTANETDSGALPDNHTDAISFVTTSGPAFSKATWSIALNRQKSSYTNSSSSTIESEIASFKYLVIPTLAVTGSAGYESYQYPFSTASSAGSIWTTGIAWRPSARTAIDASVGHRFYGRTYALLASLRARQTFISASYNEDITTTQDQFQSPTSADTAKVLDALYTATISDPIKRKSAVDATIRDNQLGSSIGAPVNGFTTRFFLQKAFQVSLGLTGARNTVLLSVYDTSRQAQNGQGATTPMFASGGSLINTADNRQLGASGSWIWRIEPLTTANFAVNTSRITALNSNRSDRTQFMSASLNHQFSRHLRGSVGVRRVQQRGSDSINSYRENAVFAALSVGL